jgi:hypothetical protein
LNWYLVNVAAVLALLDQQRWRLWVGLRYPLRSVSR